MEHFVVSALKYRPQSFKDVVGQDAITNTLQNAIDQNHLAQALLFTGPRGVGKTTCARILAKMINENGNEKKDEDYAFNIFELDAASNNSVDDIRSLTDQVRIPPQVGKFKVYIIDEVHMLSQAAFNAFLKTLEEPPKHCIFILATTEKYKIIPTILSRCQIFDFKRITVKDTKAYLKYIAKEQDVKAEDDALHIIAQKADGALRDALSIFDRVVSFSGKELTRQAVSQNLNILDYDTYFKSTDLILKHDIPSLLILLNDALSKGFDAHHYIVGLASHFRDLLVSKTKETVALLEVGDATKNKYLEQSQNTSREFLIEAIALANDCDLNYKASKNQRLLVELCLMHIASIGYTPEKKKNNPSLVPASAFKTEQPQPHTDTLTHDVNSNAELTQKRATFFQEKTVSDTVEDKNKPQIDTIKIPSINIKHSTKDNVSGLSLKSIKKKKEHKIKQMDVVLEEEQLPKQAFTLQELTKHWDAYIKQLEDKGHHNLASILRIDKPKLNHSNIALELPNTTNKVEIEHNKAAILLYLRKKLNNYTIDFEITVNDALEEQYVYTAREKYDKLKTKNKNLDLLRKTFKLDI